MRAQRKLGALLTGVVVGFLPQVALGQIGLGTAGSVGLPGGLINLLANIIRWALTLVGVIALAFLVYGGFLYITSHGDERQLEQAKRTITYAVLGIIFIGLAYAIVAFVISLFTGGGSTSNPYIPSRSAPRGGGL